MIPAPYPLSVEHAISELKSLMVRQRRNSLKEAHYMAYLIDQGFDYETVGQLVEVSKRTVFYYVTVYRACRDRIITPQFVEQVGIRKSEYVVQAIKKGYDIRDYMPIEKIAAMTQEALRKLLAHDYNPTPKTMTLYLTDAQKDAIYDMLEQFGARVSPNRKKIEGKEVALMAMLDLVKEKGLTNG